MKDLSWVGAPMGCGAATRRFTLREGAISGSRDLFVGRAAVLRDTREDESPRACHFAAVVDAIGRDRFNIASCVSLIGAFPVENRRRMPATTARRRAFAHECRELTPRARGTAVAQTGAA